MSASLACCGVSKPLGPLVAVLVVDWACAATVPGSAHAISKRARLVSTLARNSLDFIFSSLVMIRMAYLLLPPPPPPRPPPPPPREPPPREPMLEAPRD